MFSSEYRTDHRLGRLVRLRDPSAATRGMTRWLDGITTAVDEELFDDGRRRRRLSRKYYVCFGAWTLSFLLLLNATTHIFLAAHLVCYLVCFKPVITTDSELYEPRACMTIAIKHMNGRPFLGAFASSDEAMASFCEMESRGRVVPCMTDPVDLEDMERSGDVMYVDDLPHPALSPGGWRTEEEEEEEEDNRRREMLMLLLRRGGRGGENEINAAATVRRYSHRITADPHAVACVHAEEQDRRRLQVVAAVVDGLRASPFYPMLPNARSRRSLDEMCLRAMAPVRYPHPHPLARVLPSGAVASASSADAAAAAAAASASSDIDDAGSRTTVSMRNIAEASRIYEADVAMFLLELAFAKIWACRTHGSVQAAREAGARGRAGAGAGWIKDAIALNRLERGVRDTIRNCMLRP